MKQSVTPKRPAAQISIQNQEPPISDLKKLREKFNNSDLRSSRQQTSSRINTNRGPTPFDFRDMNYDDLLRLIEQLEKENAELKSQL